MKRSLFILILGIFVAAPAFAKDEREATALSQLQDLIKNFVGQYRLSVDMEKVYLDFDEKFYHKKKAKKKSAKISKSFKEQALKMRITFKHQSDRLVAMPATSLASRLDQEVIQRFCRDQNLKSKNVRIMLLEGEDSRTPSESVEETTAISMSEALQQNIGFRITAKCVSRGKKGRS